MQDSETGEKIERKEGDKPAETINTTTKKNYYNPEYKRNYYLLKKAEAGKFKETKAAKLKREIGDIVNADLMQENKRLEKEVFENACVIEKLEEEHKELMNLNESLQDTLYKHLNEYLKLYVELQGESKILMFEHRYGTFDELASFQEPELGKNISKLDIF
jgi:hypothetical protein